MKCAIAYNETPVLISCEWSHCNSNSDHIVMRNENAVANNDRLWIFKMRFFSLSFYYYHNFMKIKKCGDRCVCGKTRETIITWLNWVYSQFCGNSVLSLGFSSIYPIKLWFSGQKYRVTYIISFFFWSGFHLWLDQFSGAIESLTQLL